MGGGDGGGVGGGVGGEVGGASAQHVYAAQASHSLGMSAQVSGAAGGGDVGGGEASGTQMPQVTGQASNWPMS